MYHSVVKRSTAFVSPPSSLQRPSLASVFFPLVAFPSATLYSAAFILDLLCSITVAMPLGNFFWSPAAIWSFFTSVMRVLSCGFLDALPVRRLIHLLFSRPSICLVHPPFCPRVGFRSSLHSANIFICPLLFLEPNYNYNAKFFILVHKLSNITL